MHFHLPKPLHGWRQLVGEVGIIVLGVLIALGAEQAVEDWGWKQKTDQARRAIFDELARNAGVFEERAIDASCLDRNLRQIDAILVDARRTGKVGKVGGIAWAITRPVSTAAWDEAVADGTASRLPDRLRTRLAIIYPITLEYRRELDDDLRLRQHLLSLEQSQGRISDAMQVDVSNAFFELLYRDWLTSTHAQQNLAAIGGIGVQPAYDIVLERPGTRRDMGNYSRRAGLLSPNCRSVTVDGKPVRLMSARD